MTNITDIELTDPKLIIEINDRITVQAKCNECKSDNIAVIIRRIPIEDDDK